MPPVPVTEEQIAIQKIASKSGWEISTDAYDKECIRALNQKIAEKSFNKPTNLACPNFAFFIKFISGSIV